MPLREHRAAVHCDARAHTVDTQRRDEVTTAAEHSDAVAATAGDDELVHCRARDAVGSPVDAYTDVADELSVDAEHAHAVVATISDGDVTVVVDEAQSTGPSQLAVTATD